MDTGIISWMKIHTNEYIKNREDESRENDSTSTWRMEKNKVEKFKFIEVIDKVIFAKNIIVNNPLSRKRGIVWSFNFDTGRVIMTRNFGVVTWVDGNKVIENWKKIKNYICESAKDSGIGTGGIESGTAFFINNRGNLITNNHVVEGCKLSKINYFNKEYETNLISTDKTLDLALLKVDLKPRAFISFSNKEPRKRQLVIVAGYPLGKYLSDDLKINEGKISSLKGFENNSNEITVDLAINPGNSGGPIVNENGQLVAVAVAGMSKEVTEGISFGIKSSAVINFLKSNKISPDIKLTSFSMNDEKVNQLLEESTVYIFCE